MGGCCSLTLWTSSSLKNYDRFLNLCCLSETRFKFHRIFYTFKIKSKNFCVVIIKHKIHIIFNLYYTTVSGRYSIRILHLRSFQHIHTKLPALRNKSYFSFFIFIISSECKSVFAFGEVDKSSTVWSHNCNVKGFSCFY